ncbi:hypothetical protein ACDX78_19295 [Virgibacillus oceani]
MNSEKKVRSDNSMLEEMNVESTIFSAEHPDLRFAVLSEGKDNMFIVRVFELAQNEDAFFPIQDLAAFSFGTKTELNGFVERLPELTGLEMLLLLNPMPRVTEGKGQH